MVWRLLLSVVVALVLTWLLTLAVLWRARPRELTAGDALRMLPQLVGLVRRLAADRSLPRRTRWWLWLLVGYLALPVDLVPDVIPVIGYADDVVAIALVLRAVVRAAGPDALERHWRGSPAGLEAVRRLARS